MCQAAVLLLRINIKLCSVPNIVKETPKSSKFRNVRSEVNSTSTQITMFCQDFVSSWFWMLAAETSVYTEVKAFGSIIYGSQIKFT